MELNRILLGVLIAIGAAFVGLQWQILGTQKTIVELQRDLLIEIGEVAHDLALEKERSYICSDSVANHEVRIKRLEEQDIRFHEGH